MSRVTQMESGAEEVDNENSCSLQATRREIAFCKKPGFETMRHMLGQASLLRGLEEFLDQGEDVSYLKRVWAMLEPVLEGMSELTKEVQQLEELEEGEIVEYN